MNHRNIAIQSGYRASAMLVCLLLCSAVHAQDATQVEEPLKLLVRGTVVDETGAPVVGATIETLGRLEENQVRTQSLKNGAFVLRVPADGYYGKSLLVTDATGERASFISQLVEVFD